MKKILVFLITFLGINIFSLVGVNAANFSFYEGDYIDGIYLTKEKGGTKYYQKARFFNSAPNVFAYCIEPFAGFNKTATYTRDLTVPYLSNEQMDRIKKIALFGYTYGTHYDPKWYAITQFMIWQTADPTGDYYFTDTLNGNRITRFESEIAEINHLIDQYNVLPSIAGKSIDIVEGEEIVLTDSNQVLSKYNSDDDHIKIKNNALTIQNLTEGQHSIHLYRKDIMTTKIPFFYISNDSQDMFIRGDLDQVDIYLNVNVTKTKVEITKLDYDTNTTNPRGEASLSGAKYEILDENNNKVDELMIDEDMHASIENLKFGKYYIREIEAGIGYQLDSNIYEIEITKEKPIIQLSLKNKVIEKEVEIHKNYGEDNLFQDEEGISFDIIDSKNNLYDTITTDKNGIASIILPFGTYKFTQRNTTYGYHLVEDFTIDIKNTDKERKEIYDYKIKVPNTYHKSNQFISFIFFFIAGIIYVKKRVLS